MKTGRWLVAGCVLATLGAAEVSAAEVKVGVVLPFSGGAADFGLQIERGMTLYQKLNPQAFGGHNVTLVKRDSKNPSGEPAKQAVQELLTREQVSMLAGFVFSPDAIASASLATQGKVPMIVMNAATSWIPSASPYVARVSFTMWQAGALMGRYAAESLGCKTAAVGYTDYPPGKDSLQAFQSAYEPAGGKMADVVPMGGPQEVPDFTPFLQRIKNAKPDCFYAFVPSGNHLTSLLKTYETLGMAAAGIKMIGPGELVQDTKLQDLGKGAAGLTTVFHYAADLPSPANQAFVKAWREAYGPQVIPDFMAVAGWDGMALIAHVVKTLNGKMDGEKAMAAIKGWTFASPRGPIQIDPATRDIVHDEHVLKLVWEDGRLRNTVVRSYPQVKDPCKVMKVGKCAE